MYLLSIFLPFLSSLFICFLGRMLNKNISVLIFIISIFFSFIFSLFIFYEIIFLESICILNLGTWFSIDILTINFSLIFDSLSVLMITVIFFISLLINIYSYEYMFEDPHIIRFFLYLSMFTFFMTILITSGNLIQMLLGWEGVGLFSYLLINFWFMRIQANKSSLKAIIVNKIGDLGLMLGIFLIYFFFKTLDFYSLFLISHDILSCYFNFLSFNFNIADFISFFLFLGVVGKSAQFGLHFWLPDAMEGPTPVSALLHAATMVVAGVFLIIRCSYFFEYSSFILFLVSFLGSLTALFCSIFACFQIDLKKIIAYSTCSQLGFMVTSCGFSMYTFSLFHFFNHSFFKALLFLISGSIIHSFRNEQCIFNLRGLNIYLPLTSQFFFIGIFSLISFPFFSGFYSKDLILESINFIFFFDNIFFFYLLSLAAIFTVLYSNNLYYIIFCSLEKFKVNYIWNIHEPNLFILLPLAILAIFSIFSGFVFKYLFLDYSMFIWKNSIFFLPENYFLYEVEFLPVFWKILPIFLNLFIFFIVYLGFNYLKYIYIFKFIKFINKFIDFFINFVKFNFYYDYLVNKFFYINFNLYKKIYFKLIDKGIFEYIGPYVFVIIFSKLKLNFSLLNSGYIFHYSFFIVLIFFYYIFINLFLIELIFNELFVFQLLLLLIFFINNDKLFFNKKN